MEKTIGNRMIFLLIIDYSWLIVLFVTKSVNRFL